MGPHLPAAGRPVPVSTYRVQLHAGFGFDDAAAVVPYLADLGVTHLYCSPYLQAAPGSMHGYDVVAHDRLNAELGGQEAFDRMAAACREAGLGIVLDVVPNHVAVSEPEDQNAAWWGLLRDGRDGPYATLVRRRLGQRPTTPARSSCRSSAAPLGEVRRRAASCSPDRIAYYDHVFPVAPGTLVEGDVLATLERQHYRLCHWRVAAEELNYRRFFDVTTLAGVRVEEPSVFEATHRLILEQVRSGRRRRAAHRPPRRPGRPGAATSGCSPTAPSTAGSSSRRSSSPARSCPSSGSAPAPPATTP